MNGDTPASELLIKFFFVPFGESLDSCHKGKNLREGVCGAFVSYAMQGNIKCQAFKFPGMELTPEARNAAVFMVSPKTSLKNNRQGIPW
jgi:hypothetical protein